MGIGSFNVHLLNIIISILLLGFISISQLGPSTFLVYFLYIEGSTLLVEIYTLLHKNGLTLVVFSLKQLNLQKRKVFF